MSLSNYSFDSNDLSVGAVQRLMDEKYRPQFQQNVKLLKMLEAQIKPAGELNARGREFGVMLTEGSRTTGRPSGGYLPKAIPTLEARCSYGWGKLEKGISFDWETLKQMEGQSALVKLSQRLAQHTTKFEADASYYAYGDGSGALAVGTTVAGTGPYTLTVTDNTDTYGGAGSNGTARLRRNEEVDIVIAGSTQAVVRIVNILTATTFSATVISGSLSAGALTFIVTPPGCRPAGFNGGTYMPVGLAYNIPNASQTEFWGQDPSANIELRSTVIDMGSAELTVGYGNALEDATRHRRTEMGAPVGTGGNKRLISIGQARKIKQGMNAIRRAGMDDKTYVLGAQKVANAFGDEWDEDAGCPDSRMYDIHFASWLVGILANLDFVDQGEGMWHLRPSGDQTQGYFQELYDAWSRWAGNWVNQEPYNQGALVAIGTATIQKASQYAHQFS